MDFGTNVRVWIGQIGKRFGDLTQNLIGNVLFDYTCQLFTEGQKMANNSSLSGNFYRTYRDEK